MRLSVEGAFVSKLLIRRPVERSCLQSPLVAFAPPRVLQSLEWVFKSDGAEGALDHSVVSPFVSHLPAELPVLVCVASLPLVPQQLNIPFEALRAIIVRAFPRTFLTSDSFAVWERVASKLVFRRR